VAGGFLAFWKTPPFAQVLIILQKAGVDSQLLVDEALPHAFWYHYELPETREALDSMAGFFRRKLGR
jgi:hypothetical protein